MAVDGSEHYARALHYVGTLLRETRDVQVTLFHVLKPMRANFRNMADLKIPQKKFVLPRSYRKTRRTGSARKTGLNTRSY